MLKQPIFNHSLMNMLLDIFFIVNLKWILRSSAQKITAIRNSRTKTVRSQNNSRNLGPDKYRKNEMAWIESVWIVPAPSIFKKPEPSGPNFSRKLAFQKSRTIIGRTRTDWKYRIDHSESYQNFGPGIRDRSVLHCFWAFIFCELTRPCGFAPDFQLISSPWRKPGVTTPKAVWNKSIHNFISIQIWKNEFTRFFTFYSNFLDYVIRLLIELWSLMTYFLISRSILTLP